MRANAALPSKPLMGQGRGCAALRRALMAGTPALRRFAPRAPPPSHSAAFFPAIGRLPHADRPDNSMGSRQTWHSGLVMPSYL